MKLFERTATGRVRRSRYQQLPYSKTDKPLALRLKTAMSSPRNKVLCIGVSVCCLLLCAVLYFSVASSTSTQSFPDSYASSSGDANNTAASLSLEQLISHIQSLSKHQKLSVSLEKLVQRIQENPDEMDMNLVERLLSHRNEMEKSLNRIDDVLLEHKHKISDDVSPGRAQRDKRGQLHRQTHSEAKEAKKAKKAPKPLAQKVKKQQAAETDPDTVTKTVIDGLDKSASEIRLEIMQEFKFAYACYKRCAFGFDTVHPIACSGSNDAFDLGLAMIDALDTMLIMNMVEHDDALQADIDAIQEWVTTKMHFDQKREVSLFESSIRVLGGLLSAFHLSNAAIYLERAKQLGDKLLAAFTTSSGIPFASVDFTRNRGFNPSWSSTATSTSEAGSVQLEFNYLSYLTGDNRYFDVAFKSQKLVIDAQRAASPPLLRKFININTATFSDARISFGSRIDSTYEYYLKTPLQLGRHPKTDNIWRAWTDSIETAETELFSHTAANNYLYIAEKSGHSMSNQFDHLVCFMGGALALSAVEIGDTNPKMAARHMQYGSNLTHTCNHIYEATPSGLAPEIVYFSDSDLKNDFQIHKQDTHNLLRPETVESIFYLWRITHDEKYRRYAYRIFTAFRKFAKIDDNNPKYPKGGFYASINDVTVSDPHDVTFRSDKMESFFLAETLKYLYLTFCDDDVININEYVFNTEAHPLPRLTKQQANKLFS